MLCRIVLLFTFSAGTPSDVMSVQTLSSLVRDLPVMTTLAPNLAYSTAEAAPIPALDPGTQHNTTLYNKGENMYVGILIICIYSIKYVVKIFQVS